MSARLLLTSILACSGVLYSAWRAAVGNGYGNARIIPNTCTFQRLFDHRAVSGKRLGGLRLVRNEVHFHAIRHHADACRHLPQIDRIEPNLQGLHRAEAALGNHLHVRHPHSLLGGRRLPFHWHGGLAGGLLRLEDTTISGTGISRLTCRLSGDRQDPLRAFR